ncbi:hypothetical protein PILCRDRAFT_719511 [Piloderma croceum F 1598]|uniref:ubiquitinyl hydrolase 1 n=1 Tax=Piloderma croceum (strain F 1598) TaxID=765440 RepID=A0A0C3F1D1_PILCF|nr:hypothetical protein PILCRDRAFT_719511 [Piloderma croceum F 1598]
MDIQQPPVTQQSTAEDAPSASEIPNVPVLDLTGGPFAVIESDPGVFTTLTRKLGISGLEVVEIYDIEPWAVDHLRPRGLFFCFLWHKDHHRPSDFKDPAAERVWFANQLIDDACASQAILNVALNCPDIDISRELKNFRVETESMSSVVRDSSEITLTQCTDHP